MNDIWRCRMKGWLYESCFSFALFSHHISRRTIHLFILSSDDGWTKIRKGWEDKKITIFMEFHWFLYYTGNFSFLTQKSNLWFQEKMVGLFSSRIESKKGFKNRLETVCALPIFEEWRKLFICTSFPAVWPKHCTWKKNVFLTASWLTMLDLGTISGPKKSRLPFVISARFKKHQLCYCSKKFLVLLLIW